VPSASIRSASSRQASHSTPGGKFDDIDDDDDDDAWADRLWHDMQVQQTQGLDGWQSHPTFALQELIDPCCVL
jgi:hypothetical protein